MASLGPAEDIGSELTIVCLDPMLMMLDHNIDVLMICSLVTGGAAIFEFLVLEEGDG